MDIEECTEFLGAYCTALDAINEDVEEFDQADEENDLDLMESIIADNFSDVEKCLWSYSAWC